VSISLEGEGLCISDPDAYPQADTIFVPNTASGQHLLDAAQQQQLTVGTSATNAALEDNPPLNTERKSLLQDWRVLQAIRRCMERQQLLQVGGLCDSVKSVVIAG
jgi:hypothetical protein